MISNSPINKMITIGCRKCGESQTVSLRDAMRLKETVFRSGLCNRCRVKKKKVRR